MKIHPGDFLLRNAFGSANLAGDRRRGLLNHLGSCARCRERLRELMHPIEGPLAQKLAERLGRFDSALDYDAALDRSFRRVEVRQAALARERSDAPALVARLLDQPPERRELLLRNNRRYQTWALAELLLAKSSETAAESAKGSEDLAQLALRLTRWLEVAHYGPERIADLKARAWGQIGNALRIRAEWAAAELAFDEAYSCLKRGTGDPLEKAQFLNLRSSLLRASRRFGEAERFLERAFSIYLEAGERHLAGRTLLGLECVRFVAGEIPEAVCCALRAVHFIDAEREPYLMLAASHNLIDDLTTSGRLLAAQELLRTTTPLYDGCQIRSLQGRRRWVEGKLALRLGRLAEAKALFATAKEGFLAQGLLLDAELVASELS